MIDKFAIGGHMTHHGEMMRRFLAAQCSEIEKHKWLMSERAGRDIGASAARDWVLRYAGQFRKWWEDRHGKIF